MHTIAQILHHAGGGEAVADRLSLSIWATDKWKKFGIPERHWPTIREMAEANGNSLTVEQLYAANLTARAATRDKECAA